VAAAQYIIPHYVITVAPTQKQRMASIFDYLDTVQGANRGATAATGWSARSGGSGGSGGHSSSAGNVWDNESNNNKDSQSLFNYASRGNVERVRSYLAVEEGKQNADPGLSGISHALSLSTDCML
jgi:hypothetical protein